MPNSENAYERFRRQMTTKDQCLKNHTSYFVGNHESTCTITVNRTEEEVTCTLVLTDAEGPDSAYIYVPIDADFQVADYFTWNTTTFFAYEKVEIVKDVDFYKYKVRQCNVYVNDSFWAYFRGGLTAARDVSMGNKVEVSTITPLLICPANDQLSYGGQITFEDQVWNIEDGDTYTLQGIGYYYLNRGINPRTEEDIEEELEDLDLPDNQYYIGSKITLATEGGYYSANLKVKLITRADKSIVLQPLEAGTLTVTTLQDGDIVTTTYLIKETV